MCIQQRQQVHGDFYQQRNQYLHLREDWRLIHVHSAWTNFPASSNQSRYHLDWVQPHRLQRDGGWVLKCQSAVFTNRYRVFCAFQGHPTVRCQKPENCSLHARRETVHVQWCFERYRYMAWCEEQFVLQIRLLVVQHIAKRDWNKVSGSSLATNQAGVDCHIMRAIKFQDWMSMFSRLQLGLC